MVRDNVVRDLARAGHQAMHDYSSIHVTSSMEIVSAIFVMTHQAIDAGLRSGCTRESLRLAVFALYLSLADDQPHG